MFVVLFAYVFGGAIDVPGGGYREFLMGGIFAQTLVFGAFGVRDVAGDRPPRTAPSTGSGRCRWRAAPCWAATPSRTSCAAFIPIVLMSVPGSSSAGGSTRSVEEAVAGYALMVAFSFAIIWLGILLGSLVPTPEAVQGVGFAVIFPITFIASTFVPIETLPAVLQTVAEWNPVSTMAEALRKLFGNPGVQVTGDSALADAASDRVHADLDRGLIVVCAPLAVHRLQPPDGGVAWPPRRSPSASPARSATSAAGSWRASRRLRLHTALGRRAPRGGPRRGGGAGRRAARRRRHRRHRGGARDPRPTC